MGSFFGNQAVDELGCRTGGPAAPVQGEGFGLDVQFFLVHFHATLSGKVVATIMSNMGLFKALDELGVGYETTKVGDRFVYENMVQNGHSIGGEQSGHIILKKYATTGDGILTSIMLMEAMIEGKTTLSKLAEPMKMYPQVLTNLRVSDKDAVMNHPAVQAAVASAEKALAGNGRVLLRPSGTEPVIRVMSEASTEESCQGAVDLICAAIRLNGLCES